MKIIKFINSKFGEEVMIYAGWDEGWLEDVFNGVDGLPESVRDPIARETITMLAALSRSKNI